MDATKKRVLTGLQPSGTLHIGNYLGSIRPFTQTISSMLDDGVEAYLMVADYHALTSVKDKAGLRASIYELVRDYLALGIDTNNVVLFRQSDNPHHTELAWVLNCLVTVPFLMQAHAYKDKVAKGLEANAGLFTYPMLMAADIVLYDTDMVPVGEDQRQHLEYTREAVTKFNNSYGETLRQPKELIIPSVGIVPGTDGQKMSKSYKNTIPLFGSRAAIQESVMKIVTDSHGDRPENVYAIHKTLYTSLDKPLAELDALYDAHAGKYKALKEALADDLDTHIAPLRERRASISDSEIRTILHDGVQKAQSVSMGTLERVREAIGINL